MRKTTVPQCSAISNRGARSNRDPTSLLPTMATYDSLHRQCRTLESLFDSKLTSYSRLASTISNPNSDIEASGSGERWEDLQNEIDDLLENVRCSDVPKLFSCLCCYS